MIEDAPAIYRSVFLLPNDDLTLVSLVTLFVDLIQNRFRYISPHGYGTIQQFRSCRLPLSLYAHSIGL